VPRALAFLLAVLAAACKQSPPPKQNTGSVASVRITQFYATAPKLVPGEKELLCYGVENARRVWLEPPRQELSAALSRCIEVQPSGTTTYTLTAEGADGKPVTSQLTVTLGAARARIIEIKVSGVDVKRGETVSLCYSVRNAQFVEIDPVRFRSSKPSDCTVDTPKQTTTYTVSAIGADGDRDQERVTVKVH
jgi:hypothetical protein